ncbi:GerAB/ArcD/ProY family transporter [Niallia sp. Krafla_26]|uniref:GerAB/ArcD/ProY family transporter n=1 Tax=Niallia sp. Krafla_26 TaxID=3064703 RepID=UPI003D1821C2
MLEKGRISVSDFRVLVIIFSIGSSVILAPSLLAGFAKQDGWISFLLAILISLSFIFLYNRLASYFPEMTFVQYSQVILGKPIGKFVSVLFLLYLFQICISLLREIGEFITTNVLVETPIQIIMTMFILTSLVGVRLGLEVIGRTATIFMPWITGLLAMLLLLLIPEYSLMNLQPFFEGGMKPILKGTYHSLAIPFLELSFFLMIFPFVKNHEKARSAFYQGTIIGGIAVFLMVFCTILSLGPETTLRQAYAPYLLGKKVSVLDFFQRFEILVAIIWFLTIYFKLTVSYYALSLGLAQLFNLNSYKILLFPLALLIIGSAIHLFPNIVMFQRLMLVTSVPISLLISLFLPLLLLVVGRLRKARLHEIRNS